MDIFFYGGNIFCLNLDGKDRFIFGKFNSVSEFFIIYGWKV